MVEVPITCYFCFETFHALLEVDDEFSGVGGSDGNGSDDDEKATNDYHTISLHTYHKELLEPAINKVVIHLFPIFSLFCQHIFVYDF